MVGLCSHGLATVRALANNGVTVYALERNGDLPGTKTRASQVVFTQEVDGAIECELEWTHCGPPREHLEALIAARA